MPWVLFAQGSWSLRLGRLWLIVGESPQVGLNVSSFLRIFCIVGASQT